MGSRLPISSNEENPCAHWTRRSHGRFLHVQIFGFNDGGSALVSLNSETETYRKNPRRLILVQVEYIGCEIYFLVGETHKDPTLDVDFGLVGPSSLADQSKSKPIHGRDAQLRPVIEEASFRIARVEDKLAFARKLELPIA